jgi:hypothetical protein
MKSRIDGLLLLLVPACVVAIHEGASLRSSSLFGWLAGVLTCLNSLPATQLGEAERQGEGARQVVKKAG